MRAYRNVLLCLIAAAVFAACQTAPYTHRHQLILLSGNQEKGLGIQAYQETLKTAKLSNDHEKIAMLRQVGYKLAKAADRPDFQWEFNLIEDDKTINAWCLPGGKVAVYTGIWPVMQDENGLAVVLGHEISHALARHGAERMSQGQFASIIAQGLDFALSTRPGVVRQAADQAFGIGATVGVLLPFSRTQEAEADHLGLILMAKAGYDPQTAIPFWERMSKAAGGKGSDSPLAKYLSTHPLDSDRINNIKNWMPEAMKCREEPNAPECSLR